MQQTAESIQLSELAKRRDYCGVVKLLKSQRGIKLSQTALLAGFWMISIKQHGRDRAINYVIEQISKGSDATP